VKILYCGICASDLHTASSGWGDMTKMYPQVVGHEIVGEVVRTGSKTEGGIKVGDVVGIGAQCDSCLKCHWCEHGEENYCAKGMTGTYGGIFHRTSAGSKSFGGYANYWRGPSHFAVPIPAGLDPAAAAPMLCGGVTVYSPLAQYGAGKEAKDVGIVGIGGLGHFAVLFAAAMGANVTAITHSEKKVEDCKKLGASKVIITHGHVDDAVKGHERSLDLIVCASSESTRTGSRYATATPLHPESQSLSPRLFANTPANSSVRRPIHAPQRLPTPPQAARPLCPRRRARVRVAAQHLSLHASHG
jgi:D-arabinose 1-dehydrogenase-like Zn-dependent alcohol dehydrogenase